MGVTVTLQRPTAILFDFDGVIVDSESLHHRAYEIALAPHGVASIPMEVYADRFSNCGLGLEYCAQQVPGLDLGELKRQKDRLFREILETDARLLPGVEELLASLSGRPEVRTALLTGNVEAGARLKLGHFGIDRFFDFSLSCFGSDDADRYRLPALALERARRHLGPDVAGRQLVLIGDSEHDVLCGKSVGARSVAVCTGWTPRAVLEALRPDVLLDDLSDTARALDALLR